MADPVNVILLLSADPDDLIGAPDTALSSPRHVTWDTEILTPGCIWTQPRPA